MLSLIIVFHHCSWVLFILSALVKMAKNISHLQLSEAFVIYHIPTPSCLYPTQETDPSQYQDYKMHIQICSTPGPSYGKVIMSCFQQWEGCGAWGEFCHFINHIQVLILILADFKLLSQHCYDPILERCRNRVGVRDRFRGGTGTGSESDRSWVNGIIGRG